jgi:hypothetical protein
MSSLNSPGNSSPNASLARALNFLAARQQANGGWGYTAGTQSFSEPTCYALLALANAPDKNKREAQALTWFTKHLASSGALALEGDSTGSDNWGTILAFFTLRRLGIGADLSEHYLRYLLRARGNLLDAQTSKHLKLNGDLRTWNWAMGTASWVEPTAYALIALKAHGLGQHERVKEGETFLFDRACYDGGWNYGNKEVLGVRLEAMPTVTAYALLALQDHDHRHEVIQKSLAYLESELAARQSTLTLALGALCFNLYHRPVDKLLASLLMRQEADGGWRGNTHLTALGALALKAVVEKKNVFKI